MTRFKIKNLQEWKSSSYRKPLIVRGARQVGKTWLVRKFGKEFKSFVEINFEREPELKEIFSRGLKPQRIIKELSAVVGTMIKPGETLLFFDEIQDALNALKSLRYFYEEMPDLHLIAAGSLLGFSLDKVPTGVGRISYLNMYPMSFGEFLIASGNELMRESIFSQEKDEPLPEVLHKKLIDLTRIYFLIGGMPAVVEAYISTGDFLLCQKIQSDIINSFVDDFVKYSKENEISHLDRVFTSIPAQLGNKYIYNKVDKNIRSVHFSKALGLLETAGLVYKIYHSKADGCPLNARINTSIFKVVLFDTGLLQSMLNVDLKLWMTDVDLSAVNKGDIAEQFVAQELAFYTEAGKFSNLYYWQREKRGSSAEIDYIIDLKGQVVPVEVKANTQGGMKSMHLFLKEKKLSHGLKISKYPFSFANNIQTIPFYGIEKIFKNY